jgi:hypothetical protein
VEFAEGPSFFQDLATLTFAEAFTTSGSDVLTVTHVLVDGINCDSLSMATGTNSESVTAPVPVGECTETLINENVESGSTETFMTGTMVYSVSGSAFTTLTFASVSASAASEPTSSSSGSGGTSGATDFNLKPSAAFLGVLVGALMVWL